MTRLTTLHCAALLVLSLSAVAQDAIVATANAEHLRDGNGGGASVLWIHPRGANTLTAGATFMSLPGTRWAYATAGVMRSVGTRTTITAEGNLGRGRDDDGAFDYLLVRAGITRELQARRLYGEAEWLQADVARRENGIARLGATYLPLAPLTLRGSVYQSIFGDDETTLATVRGDYDFGRMTAIVGFSAGRAAPVLLQQSGGEATRVRELFAGVAVDAWTVVVTAGEDRQRVSLSWRVPLTESTR